MLNFHYSLIKKSLFGLGMLMVSSTAFAQGAGHSGGGNVTESDLKHFMNKLSTFLQSEEGLKLFPEVKKYNEANPQENFYQVIAKTNPVIVSEKLYDQNGVERDCMSYATPSNRFFKCNKDALPSNELGNQPSLYRIVLHELMVQAGVEMPLNDDVRSAYAVSSRIMDNVHLETYQEWVPGKGQQDPCKIFVKNDSEDVDSAGFYQILLAKKYNYIASEDDGLKLIITSEHNRFDFDLNVQLVKGTQTLFAVHKNKKYESAVSYSQFNLNARVDQQKRRMNKLLEQALSDLKSYLPACQK